MADATDSGSTEQDEISFLRTVSQLILANNFISRHFLTKQCKETLKNISGRRSKLMFIVCVLKHSLYNI